MNWVPSIANATGGHLSGLEKFSAASFNLAPHCTKSYERKALSQQNEPKE